jgi:hypothetical protein
MQTVLKVTLDGLKPQPNELDYFAGQIMHTAEDLFPGDCQCEVFYSDDPRQDDIDKFNQLMSELEEEHEWDPASIQLPSP